MTDSEWHVNVAPSDILFKIITNVIKIGKSRGFRFIGVRIITHFMISSLFLPLYYARKTNFGVRVGFKPGIVYHNFCLISLDTMLAC